MNMSSNLQILKSCIYCGGDYFAKTTTTRYCSHICNQKHYKERKRQEKIYSTSKPFESKETEKGFACTRVLLYLFPVRARLSLREKTGLRESTS